MLFAGCYMARWFFWESSKILKVLIYMQIFITFNDVSEHHWLVAWLLLHLAEENFIKELLQETVFSSSGKPCLTTHFSGIKINVTIVSSWAYAHLLYLDMWNMNHVFLSILLTRNKKEGTSVLSKCKLPNSKLVKMIATQLHLMWHISYTISNAIPFKFNVYFGST